jgi:AhpC/TSA family
MNKIPSAASFALICTLFGCLAPAPQSTDAKVRDVQELDRDRTPEQPLPPSTPASDDRATDSIAANRDLKQDPPNPTPPTPAPVDAASSAGAVNRDGKQESPVRPPPTPQSDDAGNSLSPEFDALWKQYVSAMRDRDEKRIEAGRANRSQVFPHPAPDYYKRFKALADKDNADAQCWVLENLTIAVEDPAEQARIAREAFALLIPKHADMDGVSRAISGLRRLSTLLGETETAAMFQKIVDSSTNAEVRAQALFAVAWLKREKGRTTDPKRIAESEEIYRQIVLAFPATKTALEASEYLLRGVERAFIEAERDWVSEVDKLVAAHRPVSDWPKQPIHRFEREYQPLAEAGHMDARHWVRSLYPDYVIVEKQGPEIALSWLVARLGETYRRDIEGWGRVRLSMLRLLYTQYPTSTAPWLTASLAGLMDEAAFYPYEWVEPTLKPLYEQNQDPKVRPLVLFTMVKSLMRGDDQEINARVLSLLKEIDEKYSDDDVARDAHELRENLVTVLPPSPAPDFFLNDSTRTPFRLSDYRGRAVMLVFSSFNFDDCKNTIPERVELMKKLEGRPFSLLGIDVDCPGVEKFQVEATQYGQTWRTALTFTAQDPLVHAFLVRTYPTTLVIDGEGVIRGRNLPWDESVKLVEKLVAEVEAKSPKKAQAASPKH